MHPASIPSEKLLDNCTTQRTRRGGPGGQHRNKVETAIVLTHLPTGVVGQASERRSQKENLRIAVQRLRINLALGWREPFSESRIPNEIWSARVRSSLIRVSTGHEDFPAILAEALDFLAGCSFQPSEAASRLKITSSQLSRLVRSEPAAWQWLNQQRQAAGLHTLK